VHRRTIKSTRSGKGSSSLTRKLAGHGEAAGYLLVSRSQSGLLASSHHLKFKSQTTRNTRKDYS